MFLIIKLGYVASVFFLSPFGLICGMLCKCLQSKSDDSNFNIFDYIKFCSSVTRSSGKPLHVKDILSLERVQRRATKFILNDYVSDYKTRLRRLSFLPLSLWLDLRDVMQMSTKQE